LVKYIAIFIVCITNINSDFSAADIIQVSTGYSADTLKVINSERYVRFSMITMS